MLALILTAALQVVSMENRPLLTFSAYPMLRHVTTQVDVGVLTSRSGPTQYWFRKTMQPDNGQVVETLWADTRSCTGGRAVLKELAALEPLRPRVYGLDGRHDIMVTADGVTYKLETETALPFRNGQMRLQTNTGTPLARWVEAAFAKLNGCWTAVPPKWNS